MVWKKVPCEPFHSVTPELLVLLKEMIMNPRPDLFLIICEKKKKEKGGTRSAAALRLV